MKSRPATPGQGARRSKLCAVVSDDRRSDRNVLADRGYDADAIREQIAAASVEAVVRVKVNRRTPAPHDRAKYRWRNLIEQHFNQLNNWRKVASRYDKSRKSYLVFVALA
ncbi:MAG: transposase [Novosphingobium sp.]|nr:transposase [Novosphingobium sp.]